MYLLLKNIKKSKLISRNNNSKTRQVLIMSSQYKFQKMRLLGNLSSTKYEIQGYKGNLHFLITCLEKE
jgi:hypothetical protein